MAKNIVISNSLPHEAIRLIPGDFSLDYNDSDAPLSKAELISRLKGRSGLICHIISTIDDEVLAAAPTLKVVANVAVGYNNIDVAAAKRREVIVTNTPDVLTETTADLAWALLMAAGRRIAEGDRFLRSRTPWIWGPEMMLAQDVHGATLGVVGFGRIGQAVARRAHGFGMRIVYFDLVRPPEEVELQHGAEYLELDELLAQADFISIHVALTQETRHLFGAEQFRAMKHTAVIVNTSRGPVIDEGALADALRTGEIFGAGLDVFEREPEVDPGLLEVESSVIVPHLGSVQLKTAGDPQFLGPRAQQLGRAAVAQE